MKQPRHAFLFILFIGLLNNKSGFAQSIAGTTSGSTYFCDSINSGFISLNGYSGNILLWQTSTNNGSSWINILNNTSTQSYNNLKITTHYRAIVKNGSFDPDTSTVSTIQIHLPGTIGTISGGGNFCSNAGSGNIVLNSVNGTVLKWESTNNIAGAWTFIANTTTVQPYSNITQTTYYRAIVQTFSTCPNDTSGIASFIIDQNTIGGTVLGSDTVCYGNNGGTLFLTGQIGNVVDWQTSTNGGVNWVSTGNTSNQYIYANITKDTQFKAVVKNGSCATLTTSPGVISVYATNPANAGNDITITRHEQVTLNGSGNGSAQWSPVTFLDNPTELRPSASPIFTSVYVLMLIDEYGCSSSDTMSVIVNIPIPTAISPNNDNVNDYLLIDQIDAYPTNAITIYNRWGIIVYKESPYTNSWGGKSLNGKDLPDDIYYVLFDYGTGDKPYNSYVLIKR
ncbi:MAG: gliding motility-associated C-terminal domain-containing protein [Bacteroidota bacterium]